MPAPAFPKPATENYHFVNVWSCCDKNGENTTPNDI